MNKFDNLLSDYAQKLQKALKHLEYSLSKVNKLPVNVELLSEDQLETWESFSSRFSRCVDIFLTKYIRTVVLKNDPGFSGSLIDSVNQAEKMKLIDSADEWLSLRALRNMTAHEYTESDLAMYFDTIRSKAPVILKIKNIITK